MGKSCGFFNIFSFVKGHPHVCGEELGIPFFLRSKVGTPPRVWGRVKTVNKLLPMRGDTPTCVGKSNVVLAHDPSLKGHPHVCGEE